MSLEKPIPVEGYRFTPSHLKPEKRTPGISAFLRVRNGEDFVEAAIRSHIAHVDELVAVYNRCTDNTSSILLRLAAEFGPEKIRVFHYVDPVFPPGSTGHRAAAPDHPQSLVNYYNFALAQTRYRTVLKLDDDHIAMHAPFAAMTQRIRENGGAGTKMICFSGINLWRDPGGKLSIYPREPLAGHGDHFFVDVREGRYFRKDRRFERFNRNGLEMVFGAIAYWHLKYLKQDGGFGNYDLEKNPDSRYARRLAAHRQTKNGLTLAELAEAAHPGVLSRIAALFSSKHRFLFERDRAVSRIRSDMSVEDLLAETISGPSVRQLSSLAGPAGRKPFKAQ